jgi:hypothetical protein
MDIAVLSGTDGSLPRQPVFKSVQRTEGPHPY